MALELHTVELIPGTNPGMKDRVRLGFFPGIATTIGGGAGQSVTLTVNATLIPGLSLPPAYNVHVTPNQDAVCFVTNKTASGFTVTLNPRLAANTLAAGTVDIEVVA